MSNNRFKISSNNEASSQKNSMLHEVFQPSIQNRVQDNERESFIGFQNGEKKYYDILANDLMQVSCSSNGICMCISLTSCYQGEGVSTVSSNLAIALADQSDSRTLYLAAGIHRSSMHIKFGIQNSATWDAALDSADISTMIKPTRIPNLFFLSQGLDENDKKCRMDRKGITALIETLRQEFKFIIIDAPALEQGETAFLIGSISDRLIFVIESERVRWEVVNRAKQKLLEANINILGVVINQQKHHIPRWLYNTL